MDIAIPIVFPEYRITVAKTPEIDVRIPDLNPFGDILPDRVQVSPKPVKLPWIGHAGILIINGANGLTKYYEYGRYGNTKPPGATRTRRIRDVRIDSSGRPTAESLRAVLGEISTEAGAGTRIAGAYIEVDAAFSAMYSYMTFRADQNRIPSRPAYDIITNSCLHFMKAVMEAGGISAPRVTDPRPNAYIALVRKEHPPLDFSLAGLTLTVQGIDGF